jgi:5'-nucleotidase
MKSNNFRKYSGLSVLIIVLCVILASVIGNRTQSSAQNTVKITILHTNDTHSQVEPQERNNMGGYARRLGVIEQIRAEERNVLLVDAGDFWQGTPFFNFFNGRIEIEAFNRMKYDAVTLGNHEFDNGIDSLTTMLQLANFPIINSNYYFETPLLYELKEIIQPFIIKEFDGVRIGIIGLGINLNGYVAQKHFEGVTIQDPLDSANFMAELLKDDLRCDLVICLSHLGVNPLRSAITDIDIARNTRNIDIIIGGHSHDILENLTEKNLDGHDVIIAQAGWSGFYLGRIDLELERR